MRTWIVIGLATVLFILATVGVGLYTDWLWFDSLTFGSVFVTAIVAKVGLFLAGGLLFLALFGGNLALAWRLAPRPPRFPPLRELTLSSGEIQVDLGTLERLAKWAIVPAALFLALIMASNAGSRWETILRFFNGVPFGATDPLYGQDIGFYVFSLPMYRFVQSWLLGTIVLTLIGVGAIYWLRLTISLYGMPLSPSRLSRPVRAHLLILGALLLLLLAWHHRLQLYELVLASNPLFTGARYTDVNSLQPMLWVLTIVAGLGALALIANIFVRGFWLVGGAAAVWAIVLVLGTWIYPGIVQSFEVVPTELEKERPYLEYNIKMTRQAFGLDQVQEEFFRAEDAVSATDVQEHPDTINNIRLWDHRPLLSVYNQIQSIRLYYDFNDVDVDRYTIDGKYRQVMLSARELSPQKLAAEAQTWVNRRLQYTHGYGMVMSPVNEISAEGMPNLFLKDVPPKGVVPVDRPEIYFGETTKSQVVVDTRAPEFDYPKEDQNVYTTYQGKGGVPLNSYIMRLAFALQFGDSDLLFTSYLTPDSRILYYRDIQTRVKRLAPFLMLDRDPYIVVADGKLYWIQDAYTYTDHYPYSQQHSQKLNYIRNSVKAVIDAYDGTTTFYVIDPKDPMIATYQAIFPGLFTPFDQMPKSLASHIRYPEDLFRIQEEMYRTYHMEDPRVFYNKEDLWMVPNEVYLDKQQPMDPYYVIMRLPNASQDEFLMIMPFTPPGKDNLIAWMAARNDGANYGKLLVYKYPKEKLVFGPMQISARINQDPTISAQFTLWGQAGSRVNRGNMLVIPIGNSNLYAEPVYLQAERSQMPELKRVIVATGNRLAMEPSLDAALASLYGGSPVVSPPPGGGPAPSGPQPPSDIGGLIKSVRQHYNAAQEAAKAGNWAKYGDELKAMDADLARLEQLAPK
ncbi:MAG: UPF0182 family protein [Chloroflexi bacterium]|nr:UPF0182 family protein [Chloroflexota bacterium]